VLSWAQIARELRRSGRVREEGARLVELGLVAKKRGKGRFAITLKGRRRILALLDQAR
jgi:hypothetical protein